MPLACLLPVLFIVRRYCRVMYSIFRHVFTAGWLAFPLAITSTLLTCRVFMLCNTHVLCSLCVHVLHSLREARTIRCNCIRILISTLVSLSHVLCCSSQWWFVPRACLLPVSFIVRRYCRLMYPVLDLSLLLGGLPFPLAVAAVLLASRMSVPCEAVCFFCVCVLPTCMLNGPVYMYCFLHSLLSI